MYLALAHCDPYSGYSGERVPCSLQDCIICMEKLAVASGYNDVTDSKALGPMVVGRLTKCSHAFHLLCLLAMYCNGNKVPQLVWVGPQGPVTIALLNLLPQYGVAYLCTLEVEAVGTLSSRTA